MLKRPASLQGRLLLAVLAAFLLVWLAAAILTWRDAHRELDELLDAHLAQAAALLVARQAGELEHEEDSEAASLHRYAPRVVFQVFHEGRLVLRSANAPLEPMVEGGRATRGGFHDVARDGTRWRVFATRGAERDVLVLVGEQERSRDAILQAVLGGMFWPLVVALPLLAAAGWLAVRSGLRPLRALGATLATRDPEALQPLQPADAPSEMRPLLAALNSLFGRIGGLIERERRFTGDAAHELRTPIAGIRMQAQVALVSDDATQRRHALQATVAGCDRATRLVEQLLTLSRLEAEGLHAQQALDLGELARTVLAEVAPSGLARQQSVQLDAEPGCIVTGDETLLAVLARNLVDNALRYSPPGAQVAVGVRREGGNVVLSVEDSGPGLAPADLARLGERFFRVAGNEGTGSGLGWSIARRIAAAHGARLEAARSERLGGLRVDAVFTDAAGAPVRKSGP